MKQENRESKRKKSPNELLIIANQIEVSRTPEGRLFGLAEFDGHQEVLPLDSEEFQGWLKALYTEKWHQFPKQIDIKNVLSLLGNRARTKKRIIHIRTARKGNSIYIDLCNKKRQLVKVTPQGWKILPKANILFYRPNGMKPLPTPVKSKHPTEEISKLYKFINTSRNGRILIIAWAVAALMPRGPYPILIILGEAGFGKSTLVTFIKDLVDPSAGPLLSLPGDARDLAITAQNNLALAFDNISRIPSWLSDELCRLATGSGTSGRKLYENYGQVLFAFRRPVFLNSIFNPITKSDLADRANVVTMKPIDKDHRELESEIQENFKKDRRIFFGILLNAISSSLKNWDKIEKSKYPRMADFAHAINAAGTSLFEKKDEFMQAYENYMEMQSRIMIESDPVGIALLKLLKNADENWSGTSTELLQALERRIQLEGGVGIIRDKVWLKIPGALSNRITLLSPDLRKLGYEIKQNRSAEKRMIYIYKKVTHKIRQEKKGNKSLPPRIRASLEK